MTQLITQLWAMPVLLKRTFTVLRPSSVLPFSGRVKATPLQTWTGPKGSKRLKLPDFKTIGI